MTSYGDEPNTGVQASILIAGSSSSQPGACPTNETYNQCGNRCEATCAEISGEPRLCPTICDPPACACAPGFYRLNGRCVTRQQCPGDPMTGYGDEPALPEPLGPPLDPCFSFPCRIGETCMQDENGPRCVPPALQCSVNETVSNCGALCEGKCATVDEQNRPCPDICLPPACACSLGYFRNEAGECVSAGDCPSRCSENEQINTCGRSCEPTCENAFGKIKVCNLICNPPACVCKPNFYRHNGACIPQMQCTPPRDGVGSIALDVIASTPTTSASSASNYVDEPVTPRSGNGRSYVDEPVIPRQGSGQSGGSNVASELECGANEEVGQCGNLCEPGCENAFGEPKVCIEICNPPACVCRSNFYRKDGRCVPKSECPAPASGANGNNRYGDESVTPASGSAAVLSTNQGGPISNPRLSCSVNETISQCGNLCEGKCENLEKGPIACPAICEPPACACKDGYYRIRGDRCVLGTDCELNCKTNEVVNSCGSACEPTCENAFGRPKTCDRVCRPAACVCRPNYYRNNGVCVPQSGCGVPGAAASTNPIQITAGSTGGTRSSGGSAGSTSVSTASQSGSGRPLVCGRNEVVGSCGNLCEPTCENAFGRPKICSRVCNPPACVCRPNYYRNNGTCIPQASCVDQVGLCEAMTCEEGTVCAEAESEQSARCQAEDPENNCETTDCPPDAVCEYRETECIPDKACFAEPVCVVYERIAPADAVVSVTCEDVECAPNFVCVIRPVSCTGTTCPSTSTAPFCVPGDSNACSRLNCPASQICEYQERPCNQAQCFPVATCVSRTCPPKVTYPTPPPYYPTPGYIGQGYVAPPSNSYYVPGGPQGPTYSSLLSNTYSAGSDSYVTAPPEQYSVVQRSQFRGPPITPRLPFGVRPPAPPPRRTAFRNTLVPRARSPHYRPTQFRRLPYQQQFAVFARPVTLQRPRTYLYRQPYGTPTAPAFPGSNRCYITKLTKHDQSSADAERIEISLHS
ncbi:unnamed protein product [Cylicocyclus nassatus]|uniref:TIL domain-containing protein n=1 Tax=Cylicocyclus nassatus TaxID=53992 RepID=A0AA36GJQ7_CYLNA|nr:unnamed protein product [Cylicocyclus nassatus]